ncbi:hypothetical protein [Bradyrhizobium cajani]|uniref:Uncharacterized protein n=1 Tax=Bradyrhizobium cajani TaxID=1928661 RepID=A0A844TDK5_9BRAD|nr:hypothetical protein [Bradyrhizobium cajani]MCP3371773.1 hypothetical protein [Bradyrhizobium cajani]MVT76406.1 hypothetical protein [Bradyrhizobium cajani]
MKAVTLRLRSLAIEKITIAKPPSQHLFQCEPDAWFLSGLKRLSQDPAGVPDIYSH